MTPQQFRFAYILEFLVALVAIFTAWSEIGGQDALDLMHWGWKFGFSIGLAGAVVAFTFALVSADRAWTIRSARWLAVIVLLILGMGLVTYYYILQEPTGDNGDEQQSLTSLQRGPSVLHDLRTNAGGSV